MRRRPSTTRTRRQTPEGAVVRAILDWLAWHGIPAHRLNSGAFVLETPGSRRFFQASWVGAPDIVALLDDGRTLYIECKSATGQLSPPQVAFRDVCRRRGVPWVLAWSVDDVARYLSDIGMGAKSVSAGGGL